MFKMHNNKTIILLLVPGLAVSVGDVDGADVTMLDFSVEDKDVTVALLSEVFPKVNVPKRLMGLSPLSEPSVSFVIR